MQKNAVGVPEKLLRESADGGFYLTFSKYYCNIIIYYGGKFCVMEPTKNLEIIGTA